jgi:hypothetical protein
MVDFLDCLAQFDLAIDDAITVLKKGRQIATGEIAILVNCGREDGSAVKSIPTGIVGATAKKRDAERGSADDHSVDLSRDASNDVATTLQRSIAYEK